LPKPFAWIAADVTNDGVISTADQDEIQHAILYPGTPFNEVPSWRFIPELAEFSRWDFFNNTRYYFDNTFYNQSPFQAEWKISNEERPYNCLTANPCNTYLDDPASNLADPLLKSPTSWSFKGVKSGDVNFSYDIGTASQLVSNTLDMRGGTRLSFKSDQKKCIEPGETFISSVYAKPVKGNLTIAGYQLGIKFDPDIVEVLGIEPNEVQPFDPQGFSVLNDGAGQLRTVWFDPAGGDIKLAGEKGLFEIKMRAKEQICLIEQHFQLQDEILSNEFYNWNERLEDIELTLKVKEDKKAHAVEKLYPNPTENGVTFELWLKTSSHLSIQLTDQFNNSVTKEYDLQEGRHPLSIQNLSGLQSGVINYLIVIGNETFSGQFIKI